MELYWLLSPKHINRITFKGQCVKLYKIRVIWNENFIRPRIISFFAVAKCEFFVINYIVLILCSYIIYRLQEIMKYIMKFLNSRNFNFSNYKKINY